MKFSVVSPNFQMNGVEQKKFADDGLFSKRIFGDMDTKEDYSCECGKLKGKFYEGRVCQKCETPVQFVGLNINKYGWIDLSLSTYNEDGVKIAEGDGFHLIEYIPYSQLEKLIGREHLRAIIQTKNTINVHGDQNIEELIEYRNSNPLYKYYYIGIEGFYENYNEVLNYYYGLTIDKMTKKQLENLLNNYSIQMPVKPLCDCGECEDCKKYAIERNKFIEEFGEKTNPLYNSVSDRDTVFTDKIPVISIILRPAMRTSEGLKVDDINIKYMNILKNLEILRDKNIIPIIRNATTEIIQAEYMQLSEEIMEAIKRKSGLIRNQICGTRINFSARNIISPAKAGYAIDEIVVPYLTFLELYRFEIINVLKNTENISFKAAEREWYKATLKLDEKIYLIMKKMITDDEVGVLLNRNPTISFR